MGLGNHDLSCAYFSKTSRSYSSRTALRETCPFRSLAIFRRSGSVGALDVRLNLAKNRVGADDVLPNSRSNHSMVSSRTDRRLRHYHREFRGQKDSVTALCEERHRKWISIPTILTRRAKHPPLSQNRVNPFLRKYSTLPKFGFAAFSRHPGPGRGAIVRRHERGPGCGGRGSAGHAKVGSGRDESREVPTACGRTALRSGEAGPAAYGESAWS
ncbi:hypothetical protein ACVIU7_008382 [Bradyrhizobium liaoningense]